MMAKPFRIKSEIWMISDRKGTKLETKIFYECDGFACSKFHCGECHLTSNPAHAKRFDFEDNDVSRRILETDTE